MNKLKLLILVLALATTTAFAQTPTTLTGAVGTTVKQGPTAYNESFTINAPSSCVTTGTATCSYQILSVSGACPASGTTPTWTVAAVVTATGLAKPTTTITNATSGTNSFVAETVEGTNASAPSNCITLTVPNPPPAPTVTGTTVPQ